jgi:hypothetical protein
MPEVRRFPPPWDIEEANASCFIVKDNNGQAIAYVYFESDPGRRSCQFAHPRRSSAHRRQHRRAAGGAARQTLITHGRGSQAAKARRVMLRKRPDWSRRLPRDDLPF